MVSERFAPVVGGLERQALALARALRGRGIHTEVATRRLSGLAAMEVVDGVPVWRLGGLHAMGPARLSFLAGQLSFLTVLARFLRRRRGDFDLLHAHGMGLHSGPAAVLARRQGWRSLVKIATARVGEAGLEGRRLAGIRRRLNAGFDAYVAITAEIAAALRDDGIPAERLFAIPNFVDVERFAPADAEARAAARRELFPGWTSGACVVLATSRLEARKGIVTLVRAAAAHPHLHLALAGDGPERAALEREAAALGLGGRARFLGTVGTPETYLRAADVFALPSIYEGMPNGLLEALASGVPAVASRIPGVTDVVSDRAAWLVEPGDVEAWRAALGALAGGPGRRAAFAAAGRTIVEARFALPAVVDRYVALYSALLGRSGPGA